MTFQRFEGNAGEWGDNEPEPAAQAAGGHTATVAQVHDELAEMDKLKRPEALTEKRWFKLRKDLRRFTEQWLDIALGCGWTLHDIYGAPRELHHRRLDQCGVVMILAGRDVVSIDSNRIVIDIGHGATSTFYRQSPGCNVPHDRSGGDLIWIAARNAQGWTPD